jgi:SPX domain
MRLGCWPADSTAIANGTKTTMKTKTKTTGAVRTGVMNHLRRSAEGERPLLLAVRCLKEVCECLPCMLLLRSSWLSSSPVTAVEKITFTLSSQSSHVVASFLVCSRLTIWIAHHSREVPARPRRVSVSSTEENLDLEASLASIGRSFPAPVPEGEEPRPRRNVSRSGTRDGESLGRSRSQTVGVRGMANRLRSSIASLGSPQSPAPGNGETIWTSKKNFATDTQLLFKRRITNLYVQVSALRSYVELNYSGFRKVLKK